MGNLLRGGTLVENHQILVTKSDSYDIATLDSNSIVPLDCWKEHQGTLSGKIAGVWLDSDEAPEPLKNDLESLELIAINFPVFADGRGYSYAKTLRDAYGYKGELRAIGDILKDQLFYLKRCGFDAYDLREDRDPEIAKKSLADFTHCYQDGSDGSEPVFHKR